MDEALLQSLLSNLSNLLKEQKNLYCIRALYRVISLSNEKAHQFAEPLGDVLSEFIMQAASGEID